MGESYSSMPPLTLPELERLHALYADGVYRFLCLSTGSRQEAEDLVQEFYVKLARNGARCHDPATERGWIFTAARNLAMDWHRRKARRPAPAALEDIPLEPACAGADPDAAFLGREMLTALGSLPDDQREAAALRLWEGLSLQEIAEIQQVPLQTVASRLRYATARLRERLKSLYSEIQ